MRRRLVVSLGILAVAGAVSAEEAAAPASRWQVTWHGYAFLDSNRQDGPSGGRDFESVNHVMIAAARRFGGWTQSLLGTFSIEPATVAPEGSPLLFQRGETYGGVLLVDKQHAHDLFVQLAAEWSRSVGRRQSLRLQAALRGEPAVGPTAYPHRLSASEFPMAPLSHHNIDSTHISDDVVTAGYTVSIVTIEGSLFHGEEPDENRWDLDQGALDSYAGRLTLRPSAGFSIQVSACRREQPEALEEGNQTRLTASASWERRSEGGFVAALLAAGRNELEEGPEWGSLLEATWRFRKVHTVYGRVERVDRDLYELTNKTQRPETVEPKRTAVEAMTIGYARAVPLLREAETSAGAALATERFDERLEPVYGERPVSLWVYLRFGFGSAGAAGHHH